MSIINVKDERSTAKYYISLAMASEMCTDTAWFIKNKHHVLLLCCSTNVIISIALHRNTEKFITWQENDRIVVWESLLGWLLGCVLCEPRGKQELFFCSRSMILFHPIPLSWEPGFWIAVTSVASAGPTGLQPSSCSSFQSSTLPSAPSLQMQEEQHPSEP